MKTFTGLLLDDRGATMAEYALIASLVAVVCIVAVKAIGQDASVLFFQKLADSM